MPLVAGEAGKLIYINTRYDVTGASGLGLDVIRPDGSTFARTEADLTVGAVDITIEGVALAAGQYVTYLLQAGDIVTKGRHTFKLTFTGAGQVLKSVDKVIEVER